MVMMQKAPGAKIRKGAGSSIKEASAEDMKRWSGWYVGGNYSTNSSENTQAKTSKEPKGDTKG